mgnify:CR=1 FL=1
MSEKINTGGPAFPSEVGGKTPADPRAGMTLRDHFAGLAMQAVALEWMRATTEVGNTHWINKHSNEVGDDYTAYTVVSMAYELADQMIAKRDEGISG